MKKYNFLVFLTFCIIFISSVFSISKTNYKCGMSSEGIYHTRPGNELCKGKNVEKFFVEKYNKTVTFSEDTSQRVCIEGVENYSQLNMNRYINNKKNIADNYKKIDATCTMVACVELVNYYAEHVYNIEIEDTPEEMFLAIWDKCYSKGFTTKNHGTRSGMVNNCVSKAFDMYCIPRHGNTEWFYLLRKTKNSIDKNQPVLLDLVDHSTVAKGYTTYKYSYSKTVKYGFLNIKRKTVTVEGTENFLIVNDGWLYDGPEYESLFPVSYIGSTLDGMQICLTPSD